MYRRARERGVIVLLLAIGGLFLGGCETFGLDGQPGPLVRSEWHLDALRSPEGDTISVEELTATDDGRNYTLSFADDGSMGGVGDCNNYGGAYTTRAREEIRVDDLHHTEAFCGTESGEQLFFEAIGRVEEYHVDGERLQLRHREGGALWFRRNDQ